jgi:hypothetical protein
MFLEDMDHAHSRYAIAMKQLTTSFWNKLTMLTMTLKGTQIGKHEMKKSKSRNKQTIFLPYV